MHPNIARLILVVTSVTLVACADAALSATPEPRTDCALALAPSDVRWDGELMEPFTWSSAPENAESIGFFDGQPASVCVASGPADQLPLQNQIGCIRVGDEVARTADDKLMCGAFLTLERRDENLIWIAHSSAATYAVTVFRWNAGHFESTGETYEACVDALDVPIQDARECSER
jgi:hypothetical protein